MKACHHNFARPEIPDGRGNFLWVKTLFILTALHLTATDGAAQQEAFRTAPAPAFGTSSTVFRGLGFAADDNLPSFSSYGSGLRTPSSGFAFSPQGVTNRANAETTGVHYQGIYKNYDIGSDPSLKIGQGQIQVQTFSLNIGPGFGLPFFSRTGPPPNAKLQLGSFFLDVPQTDFAVLYSDNANQSEHDPISGIIGASTTEIIAMWQIFEDLRLTLSGRFIFLPFQGRAGFDGFGISEPLEAQLGGSIGPLFRLSSAFNRDSVLGEWDVRFTEDFFIDNQNFFDSSANAVIGQQLDLLENRQFDEVDQVGRYRFGGSGGGRFQNRTTGTDTTLEDRYTNGAGLVYENHLAAAASRLYPMQTRCNLTVFRSDYWYNDNQQGAISWNHGASAQLISERANLRFKPFMLYTATENSRDPFWTHVFRAGLFGPLSNYINLYGDVGYMTEGNSSSALWRLGLQHNPTSTILHSLSWERTLTQPDGSLATILAYRYYQALGPRFTGIFLCERRETETLTSPRTTDEEWSTGARLVYQATPKWQLRLSATDNQVTVTSGTASGSSFNEWVLRSDFDYALTLDTFLSFSVIHTDRSSTQANDSYVENLLLLRLTKQFN